jgi:glycosyltransferase involved in cell wall biosynthesis
MVGTRPDVRGGITTVVRGYREGGLFERFPIGYVSTHRDGGAAAKAWQALRGYGAFAWGLLRSDAPLVHIHLASRASFWRKSVICALAMLFRRPYLLHVHGGQFCKFYDEECGPFAKSAVRAAFTNAVYVLGLSHDWCTQLARIAPRARVRRLHNAVRLPDAAVSPQAYAPRILCAGYITPRKGTFDLLHAFARIAKRNPEARLICPGDGDAPGLIARAKELGVADRVSCPGWLSAAEMTQEMQRATVFALPSHAEGVPMALLEAMSWGLPVVTTPVGGIPEVVEDQRNGVLVTPGDLDALEHALQELLDSPDERARLGNAARNTVEESFSLRSTLDELASIYSELGVPDRTVKSAG